MADVFISYARRDWARAEIVKTRLEALGLTVFFDVEGLDGGDVFPDILDREVKSAGVVLALWTPHALTRPWIKQECSIGLKRRVLVPAMIEPLGDLDVPVAFEGLQHIDLTGFYGDTADADWVKLIRSLSRTLKRPALLEREAAALARTPLGGDVELKREVEILRAELAQVKGGAGGRSPQRIGRKKGKGAVVGLVAGAVVLVLAATGSWLAGALGPLGVQSPLKVQMSTLISRLGAPRGAQGAVAALSALSDRDLISLDPSVIVRRVVEASSLEALYQAAEAGDARAQFVMAAAHAGASDDLPLNYAEAARLLKLSADQGDAYGMVGLAGMYGEGVGGLPQDAQESMRLIRAASDAGNARGQAALGYAYQWGDGVPVDPAEAARLFQLAADQGDAEAMATLARMYKNGQGVPVDREHAVELMQQAADLGSSYAASLLMFGIDGW